MHVLVGAVKNSLFMSIFAYVNICKHRTNFFYSKQWNQTIIVSLDFVFNFNIYSMQP